MAGLGLAVSACVTPVSVRPPMPRQGPLVQKEEPETNPEGLSPGALASLRLTEQGRMLLESGRPDDAISLLERAVNLNPTNGQNYYYLSEAWLFKGMFAQAEKFNGLAEIYLKEDPQWTTRVVEQRDRIRQLSR